MLKRKRGDNTGITMIVGGIVVYGMSMYGGLVFPYGSFYNTLAIVAFFFGAFAFAFGAHSVTHLQKIK